MRVYPLHAPPTPLPDRHSKHAQVTLKVNLNRRGVFKVNTKVSKFISPEVGLYWLDGYEAFTLKTLSEPEADFMLKNKVWTLTFSMTFSMTSACRKAPRLINIIENVSKLPPHTTRWHM